MMRGRSGGRNLSYVIREGGRQRVPWGRYSVSALYSEPSPDGALTVEPSSFSLSAEATTVALTVTAAELVKVHCSIMFKLDGQASVLKGSVDLHDETGACIMTLFVNGPIEVWLPVNCALDWRGRFAADDGSIVELRDSCRLERGVRQVEVVLQ